LPAKYLIGLLWLVLPLIMLGALGAGTVPISWLIILEQTAAIFNQQLTADEAGYFTTVLFDIRLPRILLAFFAGAVLAMSGAVMQGLFRNPLAAPSLIGVSSGASVGASAVIVLAGAWLQNETIAGLSMIATGAFIGSLMVTLLVYRLSTSALGTSVPTMLLIGLAVSALTAAVNGLLGYFADNEMLRQISIFQMGNMSTANWDRAVLVAMVAIILMVMFPRDSMSLNALLLGESEARHLGIDVQSVKRRLIVLTTLGVGVCVSIVGMIGFVGLVVPHMVRLLIGPDHRGLVPASALGGGILLLLADTAARVIISPTELPTGILTALLGAPFFIYLLTRQKKGANTWL
jgi:iron complex transport system permease protein